MDTLPAFWYALGAFFCLTSSFNMLLTGFKSKKTAQVFMGILISIGGLVLAIISAAKAFDFWSIIHADPSLPQGKGWIFLALTIDFLYFLIFIPCAIFIAWIFKGYGRKF